MQTTTRAEGRPARWRQAVSETLDYSQGDARAQTIHAVELADERDVFQAPTVGPALYSAEQLREWCAQACAVLVLMRWAR